MFGYFLFLVFLIKVMFDLRLILVVRIMGVMFGVIVVLFIGVFGKWFDFEFVGFVVVVLLVCYLGVNVVSVLFFVEVLFCLLMLVFLFGVI